MLTIRKGQDPEYRGLSFFKWRAANCYAVPESDNTKADPSSAGFKGSRIRKHKDRHQGIILFPEDREQEPGRERPETEED